MTVEDLRQSVAVITGGGSGIGRGIAHALAAGSARVLVSDIDEDLAARTAEEIRAAGGTAVATRCDVTSVADLVMLRERCFHDFGDVDIVINNAGTLSYGLPEALPIEEWERLIDINLLGVVRGVHTFLPRLLERGRGHIVNTASIAGLFPYDPNSLPYNATKSAVVSLSEGLRLSVHPRGVGVSCLCPAGVATNIGESIRRFGPPIAPASPMLPKVAPGVVGELVVSAILENRFLIVTAEGTRDIVQDRGRDIDAFLETRLHDSGIGG